MKFLRSFYYAFQGLRYCFKTQFNFGFQLSALLVTVIAGIALKINSMEWICITGFAALVLALELINTAIEHLCDLVTKDIHLTIKIIKDVSAAAVLIAAIGSAITGAFIFFPKIMQFLK